MRFTLEVGGSEPGAARRAELRIAPHELEKVHLHLAFPEPRNRSNYYLRRHRVAGAGEGTPNAPFRSPNEPQKLTISQHLDEMRRAGEIPGLTDCGHYSLEPTMFAVPASDLVANLLRPCFHRNSFGRHRLFHFSDEPINTVLYWCVCYFRPVDESARLELRWVKFDSVNDVALDPDGEDLSRAGLVWAAALVPLVVDGNPLSAADIARYDYDLRHILSRESEATIQAVYNGWFDSWNRLVVDAVSQHEAARVPFARFYHSVMGLDNSGNVVIRQAEADLPGLAVDLACEGMRAAGLLDSGGSCAIYDVCLSAYLNHSWYHREPRGAIIVFQLTTLQQLPEDRPGSWIHRRHSR